MDEKYKNLEWFWDHCANRTIFYLDKMCMKGRCSICNYWSTRINLFEI